MALPSNEIEIFIETSKKRTFAGALAWPGWCRSGRDETAALHALCDYGTRYARVLAATQLDFLAPREPSAFVVVERMAGDASTDYGAPGKISASDTDPVSPVELQRLQILLQVCWNAFDGAAGAALGKALQLGPRGGGRSLEGMIQHVLDAEAGYLNRLGVKLRAGEGESLKEYLARSRSTILETVAASSRGGLPERGPRGGAYWPARYFVRRDAWHILDHAWEIEDRTK